METETMDVKTAKKILAEEKYRNKSGERNHSSMHIVAFVLGLLALLGHLFWYLALPCGILAIIFGAKSARATGSKLGKAGLVLGIVALSLTFFIYVSIILISLLAVL